MKISKPGENNVKVKKYQSVNDTNDDNIIYVEMDEYALATENSLITSNLGSCTALGFIADNKTFLAHIAPTTSQAELQEVIKKNLLSECVLKNLIIQIWLPKTPMFSDVIVIKTLYQLGLIESVLNMNLIKQKITENFIKKIIEAEELTIKHGVDVLTPLLNGALKDSMATITQMEKINSEKDAVLVYETINLIFFHELPEIFKQLFNIPVFIVSSKEEFIALNTSNRSPNMNFRK